MLAALSEQVESVSRNGWISALLPREEGPVRHEAPRPWQLQQPCRILAEGRFSGWCPLDAFPELESLESGECAAFLTEYLAPDRLSMSVIRPGPESSGAARSPRSRDTDTR